MSTYTLNITDDVRVSGGSNAATNFNDAYLSAGTDASGRVFSSFLKIPTPTLPSGEVIQSVKLRLRNYSSESHPALDINLSKVNGAWTESITYNTRPAYTFAKTVSVPSGGGGTVAEIDITGAYDPVNGLCFEVAGATPVAYTWYSSEYTTAAYRPQVVFETVAAPTAPPLEIQGGPVSALALGSLQGPKVALGAVVAPPKVLLAGATTVLTLTSVQGPKVVKGAVVVPPKVVTGGTPTVLTFTTVQGPKVVKGAVVNPVKTLVGGVPGKLTLVEVAGQSIVQTKPEPVGTLGEWYFEVLMSQKAVNALNPTASLEVTNARKRVRTELKTLVRA